MLGKIGATCSLRKTLEYNEEKVIQQKAICLHAENFLKDADELIEHVLYLEGVPNVQRLGTVHVGETVPEQFKTDLQAEKEMLMLLSEGIAHCAKVGDYTTRHMLEDMAEDVDEHIDWIETQMETVKQVAGPRYE